MTDRAHSGPQPDWNPQPQPLFYSPHAPPSAEDEIDLLDLLRVLGRRWKLIAFVTLIGSVCAVAYALFATPMYRAKAVIAPPSEKASRGASAALAAFGGLGAEIAGSLGVSLGTTDANRLQALLKSHRLTERVIDRHELLPILFHEHWNPESNDWNLEGDEEPPNIWDAEALLSEVYRVNNDVKTGVLSVSFEWSEPAVAKEILQYFLDELAVIIQEDELARIAANKSFAQVQLANATDPVIISKLQALLSEQVEKAMMAQNVENFAYELVDPPAVSDRKVSPRRGLISILGAFVSLTFGLFSAFAAEWYRNAKSAEKTT